MSAAEDILAVLTVRFGNWSAMQALHVHMDESAG
jgi:hypothetical protein